MRTALKILRAYVYVGRHKSFSWRRFLLRRGSAR